MTRTYTERWLISRALRAVARRRRWLFAAVILFFVYAAVGFLLLPWILHRQLEQRLATALHRNVAITKVRMNPKLESRTLPARLEGSERAKKEGGGRVYFTLK